MESKKFGVKTIGDVIALFGSCNDQTKLLLQEVCQFQYRAEPIRPEWPVNRQTLKTLSGAVRERSMERADRSLELGNYRDIAKMWDQTALEIVTKVKKIAKFV